MKAINLSEKKEIAMRQLACRAMNFGRNDIVNGTTYQIYLNEDEMESLVSEKYNTIISEFKEDDEQYGDLKDSKLINSNYSSYEVTKSENPNLVSHVIKNYLFLEIMEDLFSKNTESFTWVINTLDRVYFVKNEGYFLEGKMFERT